MKTKLLNTALALSLFGLPLLSGCETISGATEPAPKTTPKAIAATKSPVQPIITPSQSPTPLKISNEVWLGDKTLVRAPTDPLPTYLQTPHSVNTTISEPQTLRVVLGRIEADLSLLQSAFGQSLDQEMKFQIEERPSRSNAKNIDLAKPPTLTINWKGPLSGLLDGISGKTGYRWHYSAEKNTVTFYRYHDQEFVDNQPKPQGKWAVNPSRHASVRQVLESWSKQSGWTLSWSNDLPDYTINSKASFKGSFEEAVTALAETNKTIAPMVPWFYHENKQLVIRPAKAESS
ncbi:TcpQ domain-containing protein [Kiloniella sp.]|uniref:TcpQ domain-containing protein n=1 Tax=Kiloniella sp. TaxID=1938587 RepID=UPI003B026AB3